MTQEKTPLITDEMRAYIGKESEPYTLEVDKTSIRMFARAVGHTDPIFYDEAAARAAGYRSLVAPPGYLGTPVYNPAAGARRGGFGIGPQPSRPLHRVLNGGTEIEYFDDICAGDVLTATSHVAAYEEREGSIGQMLITTTKTVYKNQDGKIVAIMTGTAIRY
ncbi:MaoC family dehydratase N-terminal domain-containing protein [Tepidiforma sp.]|uniref:MaoC family dehydratase N-terminal domain-containing protein n=1 Tax=Tepidiforma sp. TaxID=2682230 RepID=UPI002ADE6724|nr:MaoC family dehydratase N-terminal domain-containing protein [Tepidiforma sp.]